MWAGNLGEERCVALSKGVSALSAILTLDMYWVSKHIGGFIYIPCLSQARKCIFFSAEKTKSHNSAQVKICVVSKALSALDGASPAQRWVGKKARKRSKKGEERTMVERECSKFHNPKEDLLYVCSGNWFLTIQE